MWTVVTLVWLFVAAIYLFHLLWRNEAESRSSFQRRSPVRLSGLAGRYEDSPKPRTAIHEAGHAVTAWCCSATKQVDYATIAPSQGSGGHVSWHLFHRSDDSLWCQLVVTLSGLAAELLVFSRARSLDCQTDLEKSAELAEKLIDSEPPWFSEADEDELSPPFSELYRGGLSEKELRVLRLAYFEAKRIVEFHEDRFFAVVEGLLAKETLHMSDLETILGPRATASLVYAFKDTFIYGRVDRNARGQDYCSGGGS